MIAFGLTLIGLSLFLYLYPIAGRGQRAWDRYVDQALELGNDE